MICCLCCVYWPIACEENEKTGRETSKQINCRHQLRIHEAWYTRRAKLYTVWTISKGKKWQRRSCYQKQVRLWSGDFSLGDLSQIIVKVEIRILELVREMCRKGTKETNEIFFSYLRNWCNDVCLIWQNEEQGRFTPVLNKYLNVSNETSKGTNERCSSYRTFRSARFYISYLKCAIL